MARKPNTYKNMKDKVGKPIKAEEIVKKDPLLAAVGSKMVKSRDETARKQYSFFNMNRTGDGGIFDSTVLPKMTRYQNNRNILELFPDLELAMQILVSSILSPKDMVSSELIYRLKDTILPNEITSQLLDTIRSRLDQEYNLKNQLSTILREALFLKGAHIKAVLPESAVDYLINIQSYKPEEREIAIESAQKVMGIKDGEFENLGILGSFKAQTEKKRFSFESSFNKKAINNDKHLCTENSTGEVEVFDKNVIITDNYNLISMPKIKRALRRKLLYKSRHPSTESSQKINVSKSAQRDYIRAMEVPDHDNLPRRSVGKPLVIDLPSIATIPVFSPGNPKDHLGYFVLVDENGYPVSYSEKESEITPSMASIEQNNEDLGSRLLARARQNLLGGNAGKSDRVSLHAIMEIYSEIVEENLKRRLANGLYDESVTIGNSEEIYRLMLARSFSNRQTRILYIPAEYVTYFAFDYYDNGVGKSILDKLSVICSIRAVLMFSRVMAQVKSSINITDVNIELDPDDPDPQRTIEIISHEVMRLRQTYFPLGLTSPNDLVNWIQRAGLEFSFEGHPGLPNTKINFDSKNIQHQVPEDSFEEELRKQTYMSIGLSPETVDNGFSSEFATTVVANNILLSKRIQVYQSQFSASLTDYSQKLMFLDDEFKKAFEDILRTKINDLDKYLSDEDKELLEKQGEQALIDRLFEEFIGLFEVVLPQPDETSIDVQLEAFNRYSEALDAAIEYWVSENLVTSEVSGEVSTYIEMIKETIKAHYIRQWMANNNFLPELNDLITQDEDGRPNIDLLEVTSSHIEALMKSISEFINNLKKTKDETDKALEGDEEGSEDDMGGF